MEEKKTLWIPGVGGMIYFCFNKVVPLSFIHIPIVTNSLLFMIHSGKIVLQVKYI